MSTEDAPQEVGLGALVRGRSTVFTTWTQANECAVRLFDANGKAIATYPMSSAGHELFQLTLSDVGHGALYKFVLDGKEYPDPYARFLPQGVHGPAMVVDAKYKYRHGEGLSRPLSEQIIYELHIGTFSPEGTYRGAMAKLPELARLGITTVEIMPVAAFAGDRGWGYDAVSPFAPFAPYGTPDELRELVDEAHGHGLSVLLDVIYNHLGPSGNYLSAYHAEYFSRDVKNVWGEAPNFSNKVVRKLMVSNALYWLEEFHFDGLRLDATHAIVDPSSKHVLRELVEAVSALEPKRLLIAEDDRNDPKLVLEQGLDAVWADDFHHQLRVTLTGERDGYYGAYEPGVEGVARAIEQGWIYDGQIYSQSGTARGHSALDMAAHQFVYTIQNHDQIGNRALGDRLHEQAGLDAYCLASMLLLFLPMTPLVFMGQEWAASTPFLFFTDHDPELGKLVSQGRREEFKHFRAFAEPALRLRIPDPQARETFERSRLRWEERSEEPHARVLELYKELFSLRRTDSVMRESGRSGLKADAPAPDLLRVRRFANGEERVLYANFSREALSIQELDLPAEYQILLAGGSTGSADVLAPLSATIFATQTVGVSS